MCRIFLATNHSVKRWGETSGNVRPASSRVAGCAFHSFPLSRSFPFVFPHSLSHKKRYHIIRFSQTAVISNGEQIRGKISDLYPEKNFFYHALQFHHKHLSLNSFKSRLAVVKLLIWLLFGFNQIKLRTNEKLAKTSVLSWERQPSLLHLNYFPRCLPKSAFRSHKLQYHRQRFLQDSFKIRSRVVASSDIVIWI